MKNLFVIVLISCLLFACKSEKRIEKIKGKNYCYSYQENDTICLDVKINPDTSLVNELIAQKCKKFLLVITGWEMSVYSLMDKDNLNDYDLITVLKKYSLIILYVDDRGKRSSGDSTTIGQQNAAFQANHFNATSQPQYIIFLNGTRKCTTGYLPPKEGVLSFLNGCK